MKQKFSKIFFIFSLILFIATGVYFLFTPKSAQAAWYNSSWSYRKMLVIDESKVSGSADLINFPVLINRTDGDLKSSAQSDGDDIVFTSSDGSTKLDHEIESYNASTGELIAWVEVPTLDYNDDTTIYMYYGNANATNQQSISATWNNSYLSVWHLKEDPGGTAPQMQDSTSQNNDGTTSGSMLSSQLVSARVGNGLNLDGSDDEINDSSAINVASNSFSISFWAKRDIINDYDFVVGQVASIVTNGSLHIGFRNSNTFTFAFYSNDLDTPTYTDTNWHYWNCTYNAATNARNIYRDGVSVASDTAPSDYIGSGAARIGAIMFYSGWNFDGQLDEVRVSNNQLSSDWVATEYANQNDPSSFIKTVSVPQSPTDPEVRLSFDEGFGTTVNNSGSNNVVGSINGATWQSEDLCVSGKCLYFDGSNDVVTSAQTTSGVKTAAFWVRPMTASEQFIDLNGSAYIQSSSGTLSATGFISPTIYVNGKISSTIQTNRWNHVVVTTATGINATALKIAQISSNYGQGFFDEVQLYSAVLSPAQIVALYDSGGTNLSGVTMGSRSNKSLSDGLVGYWPMDETAANSCTGGINDTCDKSGNGIDGGLQGSASYSPGNYGNAISTDGNDSNYLVSSNQFDLTSNFLTIHFWIKTAATSGIPISFDQLYCRIDGVSLNKINCSIDGSSNGSATSVSDINDNNWHAVTYVVNNNTQTIYIDGIAEHTASESRNYSSNLLFIGRDSLIGTPTSANFDELRIYNRALTSNDVMALYHFAPGPIGYWNLNDGSGTVAQDLSGNANDGTLTNLPADPWVSSKVSKGVQFSGSDDRIVVNNNALLRPQRLTVSAWIKFDSSMHTAWKEAGIISDQDWNNQAGYSLHLNTDGSGTSTFARFRVLYGSGSTTAVSATLLPDTWYFLTGTYDGSTVNIYVDGILSGTNNYTGAISYVGASNLWFGAEPWSPTMVIPGIIDDVRIYNYAQTYDQILADMHGASTNDPVVPVSAGYWKFDEGNSTTANNSGSDGSSINGSLNGFSSPASASSGWTNSGKFDKALKFDGVDDYISIPDRDIFSPSWNEGLTVSAWFNADSIASGSRTYLVTKGTTDNYEWGLGFYGTSNAYCEAWTAGGNNHLGAGGGEGYITGVNVTTGSWHNLTCVIISDVRLDIYLDGELRYTDTTPAYSMSNGSSTVDIGRRSDGADNEFDGTIDDVHIFNSPLSSDQVKNLRNQSSSLTLGSLSTASNGTTTSNSSDRQYCVPGDAASCNPPVAVWSFDDGTGSSIKDRSGNNRDATLVDSSTVGQWEPGKIGKTYTMAGNDSADVATFSNLNLGTSNTISLWFKHQESSNNDAVLVGNSPGIYGVYIDSIGSSGNIYYSPALGEAVAVSHSGFTANRWYHLEIARQSSSVTFYVNGVMQGSTQTLSNGTTSLVVNSLFNHGSGGIFPLSGSLDNVLLYDYARTPAQVAWDYNRGLPVAHWKLDETSGSTAYDASGNAFNGTFTNTPTRTTLGHISSAVTFDGIDDNINAGSPTALDNLNMVTVAAWINPTSYGEGGFGRIVDKGTDPVSSSGWGLFVCSDGGILCNNNSLGFFINFGGANWGWWSTPTNSISLSQWTHVAVVYNRSSASNDPIFYINGKLVSTTENNTPATSASDDSSRDVIIGSRSATDRTFTGTIDDVRIYNYPLSQLQVQTALNDNASVRF
ncbi:DUF2341 domain-containing protein [candidate division WWE3 bacterium]|nr:DUF2341 domain-containing protein [candidate division WWE3 bacterium]